MNKSYLIAFGIVVALVLWMAAGYVFDSQADDATAETAVTSDANAAMRVEVKRQDAERITREIVIQGASEPTRTVSVRAETAGRVGEVVAREGGTVEADETLVTLKMNDRQARLEEARALVAEREAAYRAAKKLENKGYQSQSRLDELFSSLQGARTQLEQIRLEIDNTRVRAPFAGIVETLQVDLGEYVEINGEVATIVDNDPLVVVAHIAQQDIGRIERGGKASVTFVNGRQAQGSIRYITPRADAQTRTFRIEIEVANADHRVPAGISAEVHIPTETVAAHFVSPATLTLDADGELGVKTVTDEDRVAFHRVEIVESNGDGLWVTGLPERARLITIGQGFVEAGERVEPVMARGEERGEPADETPTVVSSLAAEDA